MSLRDGLNKESRQDNISRPVGREPSDVWTFRNSTTCSMRAVGGAGRGASVVKKLFLGYAVSRNGNFFPVFCFHVAVGFGGIKNRWNRKKNVFFLSHPLMLVFP